VKETHSYPSPYKQARYPKKVIHINSNPLFPNEPTAFYIMGGTSGLGRFHSKKNTTNNFNSVYRPLNIIDKHTLHKLLRKVFIFHRDEIASLI